MVLTGVVATVNNGSQYKILATATAGEPLEECDKKRAEIRSFRIYLGIDEILHSLARLTEKMALFLFTFDVTVIR